MPAFRPTAAHAVVWCCCVFSGAVAHAAEQADRPEIELSSRVERVLVFSDSARVTRLAACDLPAGRSRLVLRGLPAAFVPGSLRVQVTGPTGARIATVRSELLPALTPDEADWRALEERGRTLEIDAKAIDDARALQRHKAELLRAIAVPAEVETDGKAPALTMAGWRSVLDFVEGALNETLVELHALNARAEALASERQTLTQELQRRQRGRVAATMSALIDIDSPSAGPAQLELGYAVGHVAWYPAYTISVDPAGGGAELLRQARIAQHTGEDWDEVELRVSTGIQRRITALLEPAVWRIGGDAAGLEPLAAGHFLPGEEHIAQPEAPSAAQAPMLAAAVQRSALPIFGASGGGSLARAQGASGTDGTFIAIGAGGGASGSFGNRSGGARQRAVARYGGSRGSESAVEANGIWLARNQQSDGSWNSAAQGGRAEQIVADSALATMSLLGSGYDHVTPNRYRDSIRRALDFLRSSLRDGRAERDLWTLGHVAMALAEAYAMTQDGELRPDAQRAMDLLARKITSAPWELQRDLVDRQWPAGPHNLAVVAGALKSAQAGGLQVPTSASLQLVSWLTDLDDLPPSPLIAATSLQARTMLGLSRSDPQVARDVEDLVAQLPVWRRNEIDMRHVLFATLGLFQHGGEAWQTWNEAVRDQMVQAQTRGGTDDGSWDPIGMDCAGGRLPGAAGSRIYSTALATLALQTYYRYMPMAVSRTNGSDRRQVVDETAALPRHISPADAAGGRDWRDLALQRETLTSSGAFKLVALERLPVTAALEHVAVPLVSRAVFMQARIRLDGPRPLLPGEARIHLGADHVGSVFLDLVEPGGELVVPLGLDGAVALSRSVQVAQGRTGFREQLLRSDYRIAIAVENRKSRAIRLLLRDRVPRPGDARIRLDAVAFSGAEQVEHDPDGTSGEVRFSLEVPARASAELGIAYGLEHPADLGLTQEHGDAR